MTLPDDLPRDRPPLSQPVGGAKAMVWLYGFWLFSVGETGLGVGTVLTSAGRNGGYLVVPVFVLMVLPLIAVVLGARVGKRWAFYLMRIMAAIGTVLWGGDVIVGAAITAGRVGTADFPAASLSAVGSGEAVLVFCVLMAPFGFLLIRALRRVRWLDPKSLPSEWEQPMVSAARRRTGRW